jgi:phosphohistidine phosphatase SixA
MASCIGSLGAIRLSLVLLMTCTLPLLTDAAAAAALPPSQLLSALQKGGLVIVMRHASSPREVPDRTNANPDNTTPERQLDEAGRASATAMGNALRALHIPIGSVLSSPTYRARETIRLAGLPAPTLHDQLGEGGQDMQAAAAPRVAWLKNQVAQFPKGSNTLMVTHFPNITAAFGELATGLGDGEALVFGPGSGGAVLLGRVKIEDWPTLGR